MYKFCCFLDNVENFLESSRPHVTVWHMRIVYWIPKATNKLSEYVILVAFPLPQWLYKGASMLPYTYIACIVINECE